MAARSLLAAVGDDRKVAMPLNWRSQGGISCRPGFWPQWLDAWLLDLTQGACQVGTRRGGHAKHAGCCPEARRFKVLLGTAISFTTDVSPGGFCTETMRVLAPKTVV